VTVADQALLRSFTRTLRNANRSQRTINSCLESARLLADFRPGVDLDAMTRDDLEAFMADQLARRGSSAATVAASPCLVCSARPQASVGEPVQEFPAAPLRVPKRR
jgi:hypothetical protein